VLAQQYAGCLLLGGSTLKAANLRQLRSSRNCQRLSMTDATPSYDSLIKNLDQAMYADRHRLRRQLHDLRKKAGDAQVEDERVAQWLDRFQASAAKVEARRQSVPAMRCDDCLPIAAKREEIKDALRKHQVQVIAGETGSGKATQLP